MRLLKRKCIGGPLDGQELIVADHVTHYRTLKTLIPNKVSKTFDGFNEIDNKYFNYELENEEFHYVGCSKSSVK